MAEPSQPRCPICGKPRTERFRPFCSAHCRDQDLIAWMSGRYAIPAVAPEDDEEDGAEPGAPRRPPDSAVD